MAATAQTTLSFSMQGCSLSNTHCRELYDGKDTIAKTSGGLEFLELYERTRDATREAQRDGDARLKAAMAAARSSSIHLNPLSLTFTNTGLERAYWQQLTSSINHKDAAIFAVQFLVRITLLSLILQTSTVQPPVAKDTRMHWGTFLLSKLWILILCLPVPVISFQMLHWPLQNRGAILLIVAASVWVGEGIAVLVLCPNSINGLILTLIQSTFMGALNRVPFCVHLKTRALGFGLQVLGALLQRRSGEAISALLSACVGHIFGIVLSYILDQQSRAGFLRSSPRYFMDRILGDACEQSPRHALGGFAGGFAGVSGLKGTHSSVSMTFSTYRERE